VSIPDVTVCVASKDTRTYTELCVRSMWRLAGGSFSLVVGDCSSEDGSQQLLRRMAADGLLTLQESPPDTLHSEWIDRWRKEIRTKYLVIVDSDVEFREPRWLPRLLAALGDRSMLAYGVAPEMHYRETRARFGDPFEYTLLARPDPCVLLLDHARTASITASFDWREVADRWPPQVAYDVAGYFAHVLEQESHSWAEIPPSIKSSFRHYGGRSWKTGSPTGIRLWLYGFRHRVRMRSLVLLLRGLDRLTPTHWSNPTTAGEGSTSKSGPPTEPEQKPPDETEPSRTRLQDGCDRR